jgi:hypothetical protein
VSALSSGVRLFEEAKERIRPRRALADVLTASAAKGAEPRGVADEAEFRTAERASVCHSSPPPRTPDLRKLRRSRKRASTLVVGLAEGTAQTCGHSARKPDKRFAPDCKDLFQGEELFLLGFAKPAGREPSGPSRLVWRAPRTTGDSRNRRSSLFTWPSTGSRRSVSGASGAPGDRSAGHGASRSVWGVLAGRAAARHRRCRAGPRGDRGPQPQDPPRSPRRWLLRRRR